MSGDARFVTRVAFCPHCGNTAPQVAKQWMRTADPDLLMALAQCQTCSGVLLYRHTQYFGHTEGVELVWPAPGDLHKAVPDAVKKIYAEAAKIKRLAPNGFANQIRRALEAVCKDRNATKRTLAENLQELADRGEMPPTLAEMTVVLRQLGNIGSHLGDEDIHPSYVEPLDDFFRAIVEYVYIAPHKISEFKKQLDAARKASGK